MGGFVNLPDFPARSILTSAQLQQLVSALQGFSAQSADINWPLLAGGNIDFTGTSYQILGLRKFWDVINADNYSSFQAAIDAAEDNGGGCVLIPPDTTISADGVNIEASKIWIVGCGPSSVIQSTGSSGYSIRTGTTGLTDIGLFNLTMDGDSVSGQDGIQFRYVDGVTVQNVYFKDWDGSALVLTHSGSTGDSCQHVSVTNCRFDNGADAHIEGIDIDTGVFANIISDGATATAALDFEPGDANGLLKELSFSNIRIQGTTGIGMQVLGDSGTASDNWSLINLDHVVVTNPTGDGFNLGETGKILKNLSVKNCDVEVEGAGADGYVINANIGRVQSCNAYGATGNGIDLVDSNSVLVAGCDLRSAGAYGIDADGTTSCSIYNNDVSGASTAGILGTNATTLELGPNQGFTGPTLATVKGDNPRDSLSSSGNFPTTYTIPANSVKVGDVIRITALWDVTGHSAGTVSFAITVGGVGVGNTGTTGAVGEIFSIHELYVTALSGSNNIRYSMRAIHDIGDIIEISNGDATIDLTTDTTVTAAVSISDTATGLFDTFLMEWLGGNA